MWIASSDIVNPLSAGHVGIGNSNLIIIVPADGLAPAICRRNAGYKIECVS